MRNKDSSLFRFISISGVLLTAGICFFLLADHFFSDKTPSHEPPLWTLSKLETHPKKQFQYDSPELYAKLYRDIRTGYDQVAPAYPLNYKFQALSQAYRRGVVNLVSRNVTFTERGPANVPGRTRVVITDPTDPETTWYAASVGGGIWKTENAGENWRHLTPDLPNLWVNSLAIAASNPDIMYAGTGEQGFTVAVANGDGIFKSTNRGETWTQLSSTVENPIFQTVTRIVVHPNNPDIVLACARSDVSFNGDTASAFSSGIFKSIDGGTSWDLVYENNNSVQQLLTNPNDFDEIYATVFNRGVVKSIDQGETWSPATDGLPRDAGRTEIAISARNPEILYASVNTFRESTTDNRFVTGDVFYTNNGGNSWEQLFPETGSQDVSLLNGQGNYDNTIFIHPFNDSIVYVGGVDMWEISLSAKGDSIVDSLVVIPSDTDTFIDPRRSVLFRDPFESFSSDELIPVEIRWGPGRGQFAHRFTDTRGSIFATDENTQYEDFTRVPFEVWDINNNRQLHVSYLDLFEDEDFDIAANGIDTDLIVIHSIPYEERFEALIATQGGIIESALYAYAAVLPEDITWDPDGVPLSELRIDFEVVAIKQRVTQVMVDSRGQVRGDDRFLNRWNIRESTGVHPDQHWILPILAEEAGEFRLLVGNDGGVYISESAARPGLTEDSWRMVGNTYNTTQVYAADKAPEMDQYLCGTQDNGTWIFSGELAEDSLASAIASTFYFNLIGGDGFEVVWNKSRPGTFIGGTQFNGFRRVVDNGALEPAVEGLTDMGARAPFVSRLANTVSDPDLLFTIGRSGVWRSEDFGGSWSVSRLPRNVRLGGLPDVDVSRANPQVVWAGEGMGSNGDIYVSTNGGFDFQLTETFSNIGPLTGIYSDLLDDSTVYITFGVAERPKLLRSNDLGNTWEDLSGFSERSTSTGFPDVAALSVVALPHEPGLIWVGTEIGIFESRDDGQSWQLLDEFPKAMIWDLKVVDDQVVISTYGRGIWSATIPELSSVTYPEVVLAPQIVSFSSTIDTDPRLRSAIALRAAYDSTQIILNEAVIEVLAANESPAEITRLFDRIPEDSLANYFLQIISYRDGRAYPSSMSIFDKDDIVSFSPAQTRFQTRFNVDEDFYIPVSFEIQTEEGFDGVALHTDHPYIEGSIATGSVIDYEALLTVPIIVASENATLSYRDVAIIEPGEDSSLFGNSDFYDFVVVEGSKDLVNWRPLAPGYDARADSVWLEVYENDSVGDESMYVSHTLDLLDTFEPNDTIVIRFRLFSDPFAAGWGWVVDDLSIQTTSLVSSDKPLSGSSQLKLFPNPVVGQYLSVETSTMLSKKDIWSVWDMNGRQHLSGIMNRNSVQIDVSGLSAGVYLFQLEKKSGTQVQKFVKE